MQFRSYLFVCLFFGKGGERDGIESADKDLSGYCRGGFWRDACLCWITDEIRA